MRLKQSHPLIILMTAAAGLTACGGGGGGSSSPSTPVIPTPTPPPSPPPTTGDVTISGTATYDRVPFNTTFGSGLNYNAITQEPIRGAVIELVNSSGTVLESDLTDDTGGYSFTVAANTNVRVRVKAQLLRTGGPSDIDLSVVDNTNSNALYSIQGALADATSATATRDLNAGSGWGGSSYTGTRAAAPFALLDTLYNTTQAFVAVDPDIDFPKLDVYWSTRNRSASGDVSQGEIGTSSYTRTNGVPTIRILGDAGTDTDEYDFSVVTHEWGHYFEDVFSRSDSIGGSHSLSSRLDMRVAFGEGWANALTGFIDDPLYRDSFGAAQGSDFGFNLEDNSFSRQGWFIEGSVQSILYDIMDAASDGPDTFSGGLAPIYAAFTSQDYVQSNEATSIFTFDTAIRNEGTVPTATMDALMAAQNIVGTGPKGTGETNDGDIPSVLPVYKTLTIGGPSVQVCSLDDAGEYNRLGNRAFLTLNVPSISSVTITATAVDSSGTSDPDILVYRRGTLIANGLTAVNNQEVLTRNLDADEFVLVVYDDENNTRDGQGIDKCFNVEAQ